jgi:signal transduction histidine kinase
MAAIGTRAAHSDAMKKRRRTTAKPKRPSAPKVSRRRGSSAGGLKTEVARLTRELGEALEQQIATADVLRIISNSPTDAQPVFDAIIESAVRMCDARFGAVFRLDRGLLHLVAHHNLTEEQLELLQRVYPMKPDPGQISGRAVLTGAAVQIPDILTDAAYPIPQGRKFGFRGLLAAPLLRGGRAIGAIVIYRIEPGRFAAKQLALLQTFADQAVIAIENVRLFEAEQQRTRELTESLEQQTATSEVLRVISSSPGELEPVFQAMLESATRICAAKFGVLYLYEGGKFRPAALASPSPEFAAYVEERGAFAPHHSQPLGQLLQTKAVVHAFDDSAEGPGVASFKLGGARTFIAVPMLRENELVGSINIFRQEARPFTEKQIALVSNFAAQAVIAIENTRLLNELRQRTDDLSRSLNELRAAQDRLVQTEKLASLGQLTAGIAHEIKNPLNFVNNFSAVSVELIDELREALGGAQLDSKLRKEIGEIAETLQGNLDKVVQHGKRADAIVKNMLLHSREGSGEQRSVDINALVEESLNLAYHGARAEKQGFNVTLARSFDPAAGEVELFPQEITRVLLNLISNGFYAATKRKTEANGGDHEPTVTAATKNLGDSVEIRIHDNGTGIPPGVKEKMFNPFFTTKPAGEGTGLGLSISHDIIVKQHGGSIEVDTRPGEFTEFRIVLPRAGASPMKPGEPA